MKKECVFIIFSLETYYNTYSLSRVSFKTKTLVLSHNSCYICV